MGKYLSHTIKFITTKLDLSYTKEFLDSMVSRAHQGVEKEEGDNDCQQLQSSKAIFVQLVNWCVAEENKSKVIQLNP